MKYSTLQRKQQRRRWDDRHPLRSHRHVRTVVLHHLFIYWTVIMLLSQTIFITTTLAQQDEKNDDCIDLRMVIVFEDRPKDVWINLHTTSFIKTKDNNSNDDDDDVDDDVVQYWNDYAPYGSSNKNNDATTTESSTIIKVDCLPKDACYLLQVIDNNQIGWGGSSSSSSETTSNNTTTTDSNDSSNDRAYSITYDQTVIGVYDSNVINSCFAINWYQFGYMCQSSHTTDNEDDDFKLSDDSETNFQSSILTIYRGILPCPESETTIDSGTKIGNSTEADGIVLKGVNVTIEFDAPSTPSAPNSLSTFPSTVPSFVPTNLLSSDVSDSPTTFPSSTNVSSAPPSTIPSFVPITIVSDVTVSSVPSLVPTGQCIDFYFIVYLDDHPEDMILTLVSTNEYGSDDDVIIWDHIQPWTNSSVGSNSTNIFANTIVNQTTCMYSHECYTLIVEDTVQDGLTVTSDNKAIEENATTEDVTTSMSGYYTLSYDTDRIISYYDGKVDGCYSKKTYKFGLSTDCLMTEDTDPTDRSCPKVRRR